LSYIEISEQLNIDKWLFFTNKRYAR